MDESRGRMHVGRWVAAVVALIVLLDGVRLAVLSPPRVVCECLRQICSCPIDHGSQLLFIVVAATPAIVLSAAWIATRRRRSP